jgi:hypothetical protein
MRSLSAASALLLLLAPALAAEAPPPVAVIEQADAVELQRILQEQVPPRWAAPILAWANALIARQKAATEKAAEKPKE